MNYSHIVESENNMIKPTLELKGLSNAYHSRLACRRGRPSNLSTFWTALKAGLLSFRAQLPVWLPYPTLLLHLRPIKNVMGLKLSFLSDFFNLGNKNIFQRMAHAA